jgi:hypothetical protein
MRFLKTFLLMALASAFLVACGGGGGDPAPVSTANAFKGNWTGSFTGGDSGSCADIVIDSAGAVSGSCTSRNAGTIGISGTVSSTGAAQFTAGGATTGATFSGTLTNATGSGTWTNTHTNPVIGGSWSVTKK